MNNIVQSVFTNTFPNLFELRNVIQALNGSNND